MTPTEIRIGLLWHSANSGNLGVGALTLANMAIVRRVAAEFGLVPRFTIIGMRDGMDAYVPQSEAERFAVDTRAMIDPRRCWATIRAQDCLLDIGAGDSFADIYGSKRFSFLWGTKAMAILGGRPLLLSPQTIGPFSRQPHSALAGWALRHSTVVVARDAPSVEAARELAPRARCVLSTDVAFALPFADRGHERGGTRARVGLNVSGLLFHEATEGRNRFGLDINYADLMRGLMERFRQRDAEVHLITHARGSHFSDDDGRVADLFAAEFPWAVRAADFEGPSEAKSYISSLDFLVSGRMHACIGALSSGTPVVPVAYSRKFRGVFGLVDYPWRVDVSGSTINEAFGYVLDAFDRRKELAVGCRRSMQKVDGLLDVYRQELRRLFSGVTGRQTAAAAVTDSA